MNTSLKRNSNSMNLIQNSLNNLFYSFRDSVNIREIINQNTLLPQCAFRICEYICTNKYLSKT